MGPPGVGKGTQALALAEQFGLVHLASGDLFREHIRSRTALGVQARSFVDRGGLVPDELVTDMVLDRMLAPDVSGALLDGYPRTLGQARQLPARLVPHGRRIDAAVLLTAPAETLLRRIVGRQACPICGESSNEYFQPTRMDGLCDVCGGAVASRTDDDLETARHRLGVYDEQTRPLAGFYRSAGVLVSIDGTGDPDEVGRRIRVGLSELLGRPVRHRARTA